MRRARVPWMTNADLSVLEFLLNDGNRELKATPYIIAINIDFSPHTIRERVTPLREAGLIEYYDEAHGVYQITDKGREYLAGELTADDLPAPDDS